jgi:hypothetical protein
MAREAVAHLLRLHDLSVVDVILAALIANELPGDPVWMAFVSPPSNGKTELLMGAARTPKTYLLSTLTKNTLISGQRPAGPSDPKEPSLLPRLTSRTLILKDFTTILGLPRDERNAILGLLREVYDGKVVKPFGTGKVFTWEGKVGLLAGVTPIFDRHSSVQAILGERFLLFRLPGGDREARRAQGQRALSAAGHEASLRATLGTAMVRAHATARAWYDAQGQRIVIPHELDESLIVLADLAAFGRAGVLRDGYDREVRYLPEPEGPGRLVKQLRQIALGLVIVRGKLRPDQEELSTLRRIARDTMHPMKARVLKALAAEDLPLAALAKAAGLPYAMAQREAEDLALLGFATLSDDGGRLCRLAPQRRDDIQASGIFAEPIPVPDRTPRGERGESIPIGGDISGAANQPPQDDTGLGEALAKAYAGSRRAAAGRRIAQRSQPSTGDDTGRASPGLGQSGENRSDAVWPPCCLCGQAVPRGRFAAHMREVHGV